MNSRAGHLAGGLGLLVSGLLPVVAAAGSGAVQIARCLPVSGGLGQLGMHVTLLRADPACPTGTLALNGDSEAMLAVALVISLPALLGGLAMIAGTAAVLAAGRSALRWLSMLVPWRRLPTTAGVLPRRRLRPLIASSAWPLRRIEAFAWHRRGPPVVAAA